MIYHVFANKSNIGDWLSAKGIQSAVAGSAICELHCDAPFAEETIRQLQRLHADDLVVLGGGGLFMDYFAPFWEAFLRIAPHFSYGIWGVGYCDITDEDSLPPERLIEQVVRQSRFCYVRDELTRRRLAKLKLAPPVGCPSLLCFPHAVPEGRGVLHVDNFTTVGAPAFEFMDQLARKLAADSARPYRRTNNRIEDGDERQLQQCLRLYQQADIVLSSALHGCVLAVALGKKVVAVSGDRKIDSFMESVGLSAWVCGNHDLERLPLLLSRVDEQPSYSDRLRALQRANELVAARLRTLTETVPLQPYGREQEED